MFWLFHDVSNTTAMSDMPNNRFAIAVIDLAVVIGCNNPIASW